MSGSGELTIVCLPTPLPAATPFQVLYQSRVHPESPSSALDDAALAALHGAITHVISAACAVSADAARFPPEWMFHRRWEKGKSRPKTHDGHPIEFFTVGGRTSAVVPALQKRVAARPAAPKGATRAASTSAPRGGDVKGAVEALSRGPQAALQARALALKRGMPRDSVRRPLTRSADSVMADVSPGPGAIGKRKR